MPKTGRPVIFDAFKQHTFLRLVAVGFSTRQAARNVGVSPSTVREKVRSSQPFAKQYEDAKDQSLPALAENIFKAGQKSWRASAWLLERLHPKQFGRRVALGPDRAKIEEQKRQQKLQEERERQQLLDEPAILAFIARLSGNPRAQAFTGNRLLDMMESERTVVPPDLQRDASDPNDAYRAANQTLHPPLGETVTSQPPSTEPVADSPAQLDFDQPDADEPGLDQPNTDAHGVDSPTADECAPTPVDTHALLPLSSSPPLPLLRSAPGATAGCSELAVASLSSSASPLASHLLLRPSPRPASTRVSIPVPFPPPSLNRRLSLSPSPRLPLSPS